MLKKIIFLFFLTSVSHAQHVIHGKIEHAGSPSTLYLKKFMFKWIVVDSIRTEKNEFTFTIPENDDFIYIEADNLKKLPQVKLYNVKGTTDILFNAENQKLQVTGTSINEGLYKYLSYLKPFEDKVQNLTDNPPNIANLQYASAEERTSYQTHLENIDRARKKLEQAKFDFIRENKGNDYTKFLIEEKLRRDFYERDFEVLKVFYEELDNSFKQDEKSKKLQAFLKEYETVQAGAKAKDFIIPDAKNQPKSLYKNLGKYTLLDFWSSSCAPCRKENMNLVALYKKYKKAGLTIISVSLDVHKDQWMNAIAKDEMSWLQLANLDHSNEAVTDLYKVKSIPKMFLLDHKGTIIARDLYGSELEEKLQELFKNKKVTLLKK